MTVEWLRGSYTIAAPSRRAEVIVLVEEDTRDYQPIDVDSDPRSVAVEVRATEMGPTRTEGGAPLMLTALLTDLAVNLTASAIWAGIVGAVHRVLHARHPYRDGEQRFILTVIVPTASGDKVVESEAVGAGTVEAGLAATERIVLEMLATTTAP